MDPIYIETPYITYPFHLSKTNILIDGDPNKPPRAQIIGVHAKNLEMTLLFVDFSKAFDFIHRKKMDQILLAYGLRKETVTAIIMLYKNKKERVGSLDGDTDFFNIVAGVLWGIH